MIKLTKTSILPNFQVPNSFFGGKFYHSKIALGKEDTLIILLSAWDRSHDSTAKRNLSNDKVPFLAKKKSENSHKFLILLIKNTAD